MSSTGDFVRVGNDAFHVHVLDKFVMFVPKDHWLLFAEDGAKRRKRPTHIDAYGAVLYVRDNDDITRIHEEMSHLVRIGDVLYQVSRFEHVREIIDVSADDFLYGGVRCVESGDDGIAFPLHVLYVKGKDEADAAIRAVRAANCAD